MQQSERDDPNLAEVKAVLGRLQRISRRPRAGSVLSDEDERPPSGGPASGDGAARTEGMALRSAPWLVKAAVLVVPALAVVGGVVMFASSNRQPASVNQPSPGAAPQSAGKERAPAPIVEVKPAAETKKPTPEERNKSPVLEVAQQLMATGQVQAARAELFRALQDDSADVAWLLARSYDPNVLATVPAADASPDVAEATRWYRTWYDIATKQGLVSDSVSLDRIIGSMK
jgi:hypothetical protein